MHIYFKRLKQRIDAINQLRIERALEGMQHSFRLVYQLIPLFIHYNHPTMPGYLQHGVPSGVAGFAPNQADIDRLLDNVDSLLSDPEFSYQTLCDASSATYARSAKTSLQAPIIGIYSMGSTSFLGQNSFSDLDIWICHQSWLSEHEVEQLAHKCTLLENWAESQGVKLTLFLVDENRFRHRQSGALNDEDCGTSQHYLLLDEFYRSAVRLAGKRLLWYLIPSEEEEHYDEYVTYLYSQGILKPNEWLDLGGMGALSAKEYFGASLWQLYKSIDSPYKAVIKSLLLEAYSAEYPNTKLLAMEIKSHLHKGEIISSGLDAYIIMLRKISAYLVSKGDYKRLALVRRCFYLKINEEDASLTAKQASKVSSTNWRRKHILQLVQSWGWEQSEIDFLDNRPIWKIEQVKEAYDEILHAIMESFRNLIRFARQHDISMSASPKDINVLTRKLYAAYELLPGKINFINPQITQDLSEAHLTFISVPNGRANRPGWYLFNRAPNPNEMLGKRTIEYSFYISKLVVWSYLNELWVDDTNIYLFNTNHTKRDKLVRFYLDVKTTFPKVVPPASPSALYAPAEIRDIMIILNLEQDPTCDFANDIMAKQTNQQESKIDESILSYDIEGRAVCLVGTVDVIYRNSWNEVRTLHFNNDIALIEAIESLLSKMHQYAITPRLMRVFCYSHLLANQIQQEVESIFLEAVHHRLIHSSSQKSLSVSPINFLNYEQIGQGLYIENKAGVKVFTLGEHLYCMFFERRGVSIKKLERNNTALKLITEHKLSMQKGYKMVVNQLNEHTSSGQHTEIPVIIESYACEGIIQFFFETHEDSNYFNTYILDERNEIEVYRNCEGSQADLVKDVSRFYSSSHDRFTSSSQKMSFNLPQFYQIKIKGNTQSILPYD